MENRLFDLRNFYYYKSKNSFTGSLNNFNYKIVPSNEIIKSEIWHGKNCSEIAQIEDSAEFPLTEDGFDEMVNWLEQKYSESL